jgi:RNA polymerase sigma-70 factor (ECF subfamily)
VLADSPRQGDPATTADLLDAVRRGEEWATNRLVARYHPVLTRWAHGRLPDRARQLSETADLVQVSLVRALNSIERFESRREGAFLAYLRQIVLNAIRDEIRRSARRAGDVPVTEQLPAPGRGVLEQAIGDEVFEAYESALLDLGERAREAVILRIEFGFTYEEIAAAIESPSANAARMTVTRALSKLAELLDEHRRS